MVIFLYLRTGNTLPFLQKERGIILKATLVGCSWAGVIGASIKRTMMEATSASETSVNFYQTARRKNPEDRHLHTRHRESLKSHQE
jgi:hypothetical protein